MAADPMTADEDASPSLPPPRCLSAVRIGYLVATVGLACFGFVTPMSAAFFVSCCMYDELVHFRNHTTASIQALLPI